jgi:hypothetical protein
MSTTRAAITPSSDVNVGRDDALDEDRSATSPGRGERLDGTADVPDRQLRIRKV